MSDDMKTIAKEWLITRNIIVEFLRKLRPDHSQDILEHNAAALIAELASHDPPILLEFCHEEV